MANVTYQSIIRDGLWDKNVVFAQMLAMCPVMAVTGTATNALGMGIATTFVLIASGLLISAFRQYISEEVRIPVFILLIATVVTLVDMAMNAWVHELYKVLGLFIPLIVTNCVVLGRAEAFAVKNPVHFSAFDGLMMGIGFTLAIVAMGAIREVLGGGTLFANASGLLGNIFSFMELTVIPNYNGFLIMILPPGGFLTLGFLLAAKQNSQIRAKQKVAAAPGCHSVPQT